MSSADCVVVLKDTDVVLLFIFFEAELFFSDLTVAFAELICFDFDVLLAVLLCTVVSVMLEISSSAKTVPSVAFTVEYVLSPSGTDKGWLSGEQAQNNIQMLISKAKAQQNLRINKTPDR